MYINTVHISVVYSLTVLHVVLKMLNIYLIFVNFASIGLYIKQVISLFDQVQGHSI
jgi:hypothetical protein